MNSGNSALLCAILAFMSYTVSAMTIFMAYVTRSYGLARYTAFIPLMMGCVFLGTLSGIVDADSPLRYLVPLACFSVGYTLLRASEVVQTSILRRRESVSSDA